MEVPERLQFWFELPPWEGQHVSWRFESKVPKCIMDDGRKDGVGRELQGFEASP